MPKLRSCPRSPKLILLLVNTWDSMSHTLNECVIEQLVQFSGVSWCQVTLSISLLVSKASVKSSSPRQNHQHSLCSRQFHVWQAELGVLGHWCTVGVIPRVYLVGNHHLAEPLVRQDLPVPLAGQGDQILVGPDGSPRMMLGLLGSGP